MSKISCFDIFIGEKYKIILKFDKKESVNKIKLEIFSLKK
jgi:hypothetical protein